jgi:adenylate cyclase, class 2
MVLLVLHPKFIGTDHQIDTYFNVQKGRLKLREGNIENALIQYNRANVLDAKHSDVILYKHAPNIALKNILTLQFGIKIIIDKQRKIYFIDNIKFHFDEVQHLGTFLEVEAIDDNNRFSSEKLKAQCDFFFNFFELKKSDLMKESYSDMLME